MKIAYLTTALPEERFNQLVSSSAVSPNPAGQNFHAKTIRALAQAGNIVQVHSLFPVSGQGHSETIPEGLFLVYKLYPRPSSRFQRIFAFPRRFQKSIEKENKPDIIVYDSLNLTLAKTAQGLRKHWGIPAVAFLTDDPKNITGGRCFYQKECLRLSSKADGYFVLTKKLHERFSKKDAPYLQFLGIVENVPSYPCPLDRPYLYYGGALYEKDGALALFHAWEKTQPDYDLVIAGHGPLSSFFHEVKNPRFHFLGQISKQNNYAYEQHAVIAFNPRRYNPSLDEVSVPSKDLEYLVCSRSIAATYSQEVDALFHSDINWVPKSEINLDNAWMDFFSSHLDPQGHWVHLIPNQARQSVLKEMGMEAMGTKMTAFLTSLIQPEP